MKNLWFGYPILVIAVCSSHAAAQTEAREWSDLTGNFKITATLIEVKDGHVFLKSAEGKTIKIPVAKLSKTDQDVLKSVDNPFEEVVEGAPNKPAAADTATPPAVGDGSAAGWNSPLKIDWEEVEDLDRSFDGEWKVTLPARNEISFTPKRATLNKKSNFHEDIRRLEFNPLAQRAVVGYTVSFGVPKPQSRVALIDLASGRAIHSAPVECDMCPLALLNDGSTLLMQGTSDERKGFETPDQLQLWRMNGKKVVQSKTWIPFPDDAESWGKRVNGAMITAIPLPNNKLILLTGNGHLACIDIVTRKPFWHARLSDHFAIEASTDRSLLAVADGHMIMIVDPQTGSVKSSVFLDDKPHIAWPRVRWSPSGTKLLFTFNTEMRVLDLTSGNWTQKCSFAGGPIAANGLSYPHDDYALLNNNLLVHIPSQIKVCDYRSASSITCVGGTAFIGVQGGDGGLVVPAKFPHPAAEKVLAQAEKDPSVFLIHPGVQVSIDASGAGQWASQVSQSLAKAASEAGYKVVPNAAVKIVAAVTGPRQEAIAYIARGSYIASIYDSSIKVNWQGRDVWSAGGNNVPGFLQTGRDESIQDKLNELGKTPNLNIFANVKFPKLLQKPSADSKQQGLQSDALLVSTFTLQGLVDAK